ncbi:MAG: DUF805 domain-containing protein [Campylobacter sp.]|nr:DUF805 domain-containing protein [Campylobacter sp.]
MTFKEALKTFPYKCTDFKGRAARSEYWYFSTFIYFLSLLLLATSFAVIKFLGA